MYTVIFMLASAATIFILDSSQKAAEEKILENIVKDARKRAKKAEAADKNAETEKEG